MRDGIIPDPCARLFVWLFRSKHEEIELVSVQEFYKEAPPEISKPDITLGDPHQQTLSRLDWELEQRKQWVFVFEFYR